MIFDISHDNPIITGITFNINYCRNDIGGGDFITTLKYEAALTQIPPVV